MIETALVVAAHPDDEVLGCGGTIARLAAQGAAVHVAFVADGVGARAGSASAKQAELSARRDAARAANRLLGVTSVIFGDFPDNRLDTLALLEIVRFVEALIAEYRPATVFTHHAGDLNIDHRRVHEAVVTACRPQPGHSLRTLLFFEVVSSTEWQPPHSGPAYLPNWFVDITDTLERKLDALDGYGAELRPWPHPRSREGVKHLACWRGAAVGVQAAEAFMLGRHKA